MCKRIVILMALALAGCEGATSQPQPQAATPSPFRPQDKVVPVALAPDRPHAPPPSAVEVQRVPRAPTQ